jgi:hypothetical protein
MDRRTRREPGDALVFLGLVGDHADRAGALGGDLPADLRHVGMALDLLAAGHGHGVVVQDLVGDVHAGRDRGADREQTGVGVGAVAQIGEDVLLVDERRLTDPGHALAAHLGEGLRAAVHPDDHVVAADAGHRAAALGHAGRGVVRAARAEIGQARDRRGLGLQLALLLLEEAQARTDLVVLVIGLQACRDHARDARRVELTGRGQNPVALLVELADHARPSGRRVVVHLLLELILDQRALLLDDDDVAEPVFEAAHALGLEGPGHGDLVEADADIGRLALVDAQVLQRLTHVEKSLAGRDDPEPGVRAVDDDAVERVRAVEGERRVELVAVQAQFLLERRIGPADVQPAGRHGEVVRLHDRDALGVDVDRGRAVGRIRDDLHADPEAGVARQRPAVEAVVDQLLHVGRVQHRHAGRDQLVLALVRQGRGLAGVVVAGQRETCLRRWRA